MAHTARVSGERAVCMRVCALLGYSSYKDKARTDSVGTVSSHWWQMEDENLQTCGLASVGVQTDSWWDQQDHGPAHLPGREPQSHQGRHMIHNGCIGLQFFQTAGWLVSGLHNQSGSRFLEWIVKEFLCLWYWLYRWTLQNILLAMGRCRFVKPAPFILNMNTLNIHIFVGIPLLALNKL